MKQPCCDKEGTNKGAWSKQEDQKLIDHVRMHGEGKWSNLPKLTGLRRCGKSCRLRWINYLRPNIKRGNFSQDEEDLIIKLHALLGNRWSLIAGRLPGRTDNEVKNYWNSRIRKKLIRLGVDPNHHKLCQTLPRPREDRTEPGVDASRSDNTICKVSGRASCLEMEETSPDSPSDHGLNLDLTIAVPSQTGVLTFIDDDQTSVKLVDTNDDNDEDGIRPTLILFR